MEFTTLTVFKCPVRRREARSQVVWPSPSISRPFPRPPRHLAPLDTSCPSLRGPAPGSRPSALCPGDSGCSGPREGGTTRPALCCGSCALLSAASAGLVHTVACVHLLPSQGGTMAVARAGRACRPPSACWLLCVTLLQTCCAQTCLSHCRPFSRAHIQTGDGCTVQ